VHHLQAGTSNWYKIEHKIFSEITGNWRGEPLAGHQVIVQLIATTTTKIGLTMHYELDRNTYPAGLKVSDGEREAINVIRHEFHGEWKYAISPTTDRLLR